MLLARGGRQTKLWKRRTRMTHDGLSPALDTAPDTCLPHFLPAFPELITCLETRCSSAQAFFRRQFNKVIAVEADAPCCHDSCPPSVREADPPSLPGNRYGVRACSGAVLQGAERRELRAALRFKVRSAKFHFATLQIGKSILFWAGVKGSCSRSLTSPQ